MRPDSQPVNITLNLPSLPDEAVVEIQDFLYEILDLFMTHYSHQIERFYESYSSDNIVRSDPNFKPSNEDPPF